MFRERTDMLVLICSAVRLPSPKNALKDDASALVSALGEAIVVDVGVAPSPDMSCWGSVSSSVVRNSTVSSSVDDWGIGAPPNLLAIGDNTRCSGVGGLDGDEEGEGNSSSSLLIELANGARSSYIARNVGVTFNAPIVGKLAWWQITDCDEPDNLGRMSVTESRMTC